MLKSVIVVKNSMKKIQLQKRINGHKYKIGGIAVLSTYESNVFYADLCDDCVKDLNKFLNGKLFTEWGGKVMFGKKRNVENVEGKL